MARQKGVGSRYVFVVNPNNPKEKPIYDFLEQQYNKSDTIKSILAKLLDGKPIDMSEYCDMNCVIQPTESDNNAIEVQQQNVEAKEQEIIKEEVIAKPKPKKEDKKAIEVQSNIELEWESYRM